MAFRVQQDISIMPAQGETTDEQVKDISAVGLTYP